MKFTKKNYKLATRTKMLKADPLVKTLIQSIKNVMDRAFAGEYKSKQPASDNSNYFHAGVSDKFAGKFLPARFTREIAIEFNKLAEGKASIKLTAPNDLLSNKANAADTWESNIIESKFKSTGWIKDKTFSEISDGKFRLILPDYYAKGCIGCHSKDNGKTLHQNHPATGVKVGDLGGAISVSINNNNNLY